MTVEIQEMIILSVAVLNAVSDLRKREILLWPTVVFAAAGVIYNVVSGAGAIFILTGLIPGALLTGLSFLSGFAVGLGDAVFLCALGVWIGGKEAFLTVIIALGLQAAVSVVYKLCGGKKKELPFIPAVSAAYLLLLLID